MRNTNNLSTNPLNPEFNPQGKSESRNLETLRFALNNKFFLDYIERYKWTGLPEELTQDLIERILYFRFKGMFFKYLDEYFFLPLVLNGQLDSYGRYNHITPTLFSGQWNSQTKKYDDGQFLPETESDKRYKVHYSTKGEVTDRSAVILNDQSLQISQTLTPFNGRAIPLIDQQVDILVLVNIDLMSSAKVYTIVAPDQATKEAIEAEMSELDDNIRNGNRFVVLTNTTGQKLEELQGTTTKDTARYFQTYQSIENLKKDLLGTASGSVFQKQEHMTESETEMNSGGSSVLMNGLRQRQEFCEIVNHLWGLNISVKCAQTEQAGIVGEESSQTEQIRGDE